MSVDFNTWLGAPGSDLSPLATTAAAQRAVAAWKRISDKPTSVAFRKPDDTDLAAQSVRLEFDDSARRAESEAGRGTVRRLIIFGVKDHPTVTDTDVRKGYRLIHDGGEYTVVSVIDSIGERQAIAEKIS